MTPLKIMDIMCVIACIIFIVLMVLLAIQHSPDFQDEPEQFIEWNTQVVRTICGPCFALTVKELLECGKRIGRYEIVYADGVCRLDIKEVFMPYMLVSKDTTLYERMSGNNFKQIGYDK